MLQNSRALAGPENQRLIKTWLTSVRNERVRTAKALLMGTETRDILHDVLQGVKDNYVRNTENEITVNRMQQGRVAASLHNIDNKLRVQAMTWLDRNISAPFTQSYLLFSFYAPMNILEIALKSSLSGITPWWRGSPYNRNASLLYNIKGVVPIQAIFESPFDPNIRIPEEAIKSLAKGDLDLAGRRAAVAESNSWFNKLVTGGWIRAFGIGLKDVLGYNLGTVINDTQRAHYIGTMYRKMLVRQAPDQVESATVIAQAIVPDLDRYTKAEWADAIRQKKT